MAKILLIGATGLIGRQLLDMLLERGQEVHVLTRRVTGASSPSLTETVADPSEWATLAADIKADVVMSAIGTTWAQSGKSQDAFRAVDQHLVLGVMQAAHDNGARQAITVSSTGASASSPTFYLRVKGEVEQAVKAMGFERVDIMRPGLLRGERGNDRRLGERLGIMLSPFTDLAMSFGPLRRYRSIDAAAVARAIAALAGKGGKGNLVHENDAILRLARDKQS